MNKQTSDTDKPPVQKSLNLQESYDIEAGRYDKFRYESSEGQFFNQLENEMLVDVIQPIPQMKILDVPAGTGRIVIPLSKTGVSVFGADISTQMLMEAKKKAENANIKNISFQAVDGLNLPFRDNTFDVVTSFKFFHLISNDQKRLFIDEMLRVVVPGGRLVLEFNSPFYGIFLAFYRYFIRTNKRFLIRKKCLFPDQVKHLFKDLHIVNILGVKFPFSGFFSKIFGKKLVMSINKSMSNIPVLKHLNYVLFVEVLKEDTR